MQKVGELWGGLWYYGSFQVSIFFRCVSCGKFPSYNHTHPSSVRFIARWRKIILPGNVLAVLIVSQQCWLGQKWTGKHLFSRRIRSPSLCDMQKINVAIWDRYLEWRRGERMKMARHAAGRIFCTPPPLPLSALQFDFCWGGGAAHGREGAAVCSRHQPLSPRRPT